MSTKVRCDHWFQAAIAVGTAPTGSDPIAIKEFAHLGFVIPTSGITTFTYYGATDENGTYYPLTNASGGPVTQAVATGKYIQADLTINSVAMLKLVGNATGVVDIFMKF